MELTATNPNSIVLGTPKVAGSNAQRWTGRVMSGISILFLALDAVGKLARAAPVIKGSVELGYRPESVFGIGLVLLLCVAAYAIPRTSALGALALTGYLGGAVATHVRVGNPLFTHTLFPVYLAILVWGGLVLRNPRVRAAFSLLAPN